MAEEEAERERLRLLALQQESTEEVARIVATPLMQFGESFKRVRVKRRVVTAHDDDDLRDDAEESGMRPVSSPLLKTEDEALFASLLKKAHDHKRNASGLRWLNKGSTQPIDGMFLNSPELSEALMHKTEFTQQEWTEFRIKDLRMTHFVKAGDSYFRPALAKAAAGAEHRATRPWATVTGAATTQPRTPPPGLRSAASALQHVWAHMCEIELESAGVGDGAGFQWQTFPAATARAGAARASESVAGEVLEANMSAEYNPVTVVPQPRVRALYILPKTSAGVQMQAEGERACAAHVRQQHEMATMHRLKNADRSHIFLVSPRERERTNGGGGGGGREM